jgi:uncharacterized protein YndB with AHSA1/START domain
MSVEDGANRPQLGRATAAKNKKRRLEMTPKTVGKLKLDVTGDREIRMTREFHAPRQMLWDCHTKPELVRKWLLGPEGWTMPVCDIDLRVGGKYRYVWEKNGAQMGMGGVFREIDAPAKLSSREVFDEDWTGGETIATQTFVEKNGRTILTTTILYASKEGRDRALATPMLDGMEAGYARLDDIFAKQA